MQGNQGRQVAASRIPGQQHVVKVQIRGEAKCDNQRRLVKMS